MLLKTLLTVAETALEFNEIPFYKHQLAFFMLTFSLPAILSRRLLSASYFILALSFFGLQNHTLKNNPQTSEVSKNLGSL